MDKAGQTELRGLNILRRAFEDTFKSPDKLREIGGLGTTLFVHEITRDVPSMILAGTFAIVGIALAVDVLFRFLERLAPPSRDCRTPSGRLRIVGTSKATP